MTPYDKGTGQLTYAGGAGRPAHVDGILNIRKEAGFTSFDVIAVLRGILHTRRIGHTGTLDPVAEGVLPVCVGKATSLVEMLTDKPVTVALSHGHVDHTGNARQFPEVWLHPADQGVNIPALCDSIKEEVTYKVAAATGVTIRSVDVCVDSIVA